MATPKKDPRIARSESKEVHGLKDVEYPSIYSNFMGVGATPFDVSIIFAEVDQHGRTPEATPKMKVLMAPEQAANLVLMLTQTLKQFVTANGQLRNGGRMEISNEG